MCQTVESSPARTQPEPRKPGYVLARFTPVCTHTVASEMREGSTSRRMETVIGSLDMALESVIGSRLRGCTASTEGLPVGHGGGAQVWLTSGLDDVRSG